MQTSDILALEEVRRNQMTHFLRTNIINEIPGSVRKSDTEPVSIFRGLIPYKPMILSTPHPSLLTLIFWAYFPLSHPLGSLITLYVAYLFPWEFHKCVPCVHNCFGSISSSPMTTSSVSGIKSLTLNHHPTPLLAPNCLSSLLSLRSYPVVQPKRDTWLTPSQPVLLRALLTQIPSSVLLLPVPPREKHTLPSPRYFHSSSSE